MKKFKIDVYVGEFETLDDASMYFMDNTASFADGIIEVDDNDK